MKTIFASLLLAAATCASAQTLLTKNFSADPSPHFFAGQYVVYATDDQNNSGKYWDSTSWRVLTSTDLASWKDHGPILPASIFKWASADAKAWAPEAFEHKGKYYFFAPVGGKQIGVAVSDNPLGPFVDLIGKPLVETPRDANAGAEPIDPAVFIDKDQRIYLYFGTRVPKVVELSDDLTRSVGAIKDVAVRNFPAKTGYGEAPFLHQRNGVYYFSFSTGWPGQIVYATGASPLGPFDYRGVLLDFLPISTNHHAILERDGKSLLFYHDKVLPGGGDHKRSILMTELAYGADGSLQAPASKPLFRDPVFDGAADPSIIYSQAEQKWLMFYTNRRANVPGLSSVSWVHGTPIGIAESHDGRQWRYRGTVDFPKDIPHTSGTPTYWAPAVLAHEGTYHMYLTIVPGIFEDWKHPRAIVHLTSSDLKKWTYQSTLKLASDRVIDAGVLRLPDGTWRMWYNNEPTGKSIYYADSKDLYHWTDKGSARLTRDRGEAPLPFFWKGKYWLLTDLLGNAGLGAYRSDDAQQWSRQPHSLLDKPGRGTDDQNGGHHPEVVISGERAYLFYFVHPGVPDNKRSSIQVTELKLVDGWLSVDRDAPTYLKLQP
ncbi:MAG: family 43 glycosylhydrolase [Duganella sp.]